MYNFPIGVLLESFRLNRTESIKRAAELGAKGIQMYATEGENAPENLNASQRKALLDEVRSYGMEFSALVGQIGHGFGNKEENPALIERMKPILELGKDLGTDVVMSHIGVIPKDPNHDRYKIMQEACQKLGEFAESIGSYFAVETGPEPSEVLRDFILSLGNKGIAVNLDPANLVMIQGEDPVNAVHNLGEFIVHTHAKDGEKYGPCDPEVVYKIVHTPLTGMEETAKKPYAEVPLGTGQVDFAKYLAALEEVGYRGFLTIEREVGANPEADIKTAVDFLSKTIAEN